MPTRRRSVLAGLAAQPLLAGWSAARSEPGRRPEAGPHGVKALEPVWIPLKSGLRLSARLWLPRGGPDERFPVVLEYIPYRTRDSYRLIDDHWGPQLAAGGVGFARVDIRGSGDSDGLLHDEYLASEQQDGVEIIAWLAAQPWCNGNVGMRGLSWGGFSTLQVAALAPPALKAIMPMCATDMRFWNDAHYVGGAPGLTNLKWAAGFEMVMSGPPDPAVVGDRWESMWRSRLEATPSIAARWLSHQSNDAYWRHGSVGLDPGAIRCPVYLVDGWADSYAESAERLLRAISTPKKALFGPWGHIYPDLARPGPGLDWAYEELRWWRRWLADEENGVMDGPVFRFFMPYATPAETGMKDLPGRWASESSWPSPNIAPRTFYLAPGRLQSSPPPASRLQYVADKVVGLTKPEWIPYAQAELPRDQRPDDARSLVFDSEPLGEALEIVGVPSLRLTVASDRPVAKIAARLCEVAPDGASWLVTTGLLDLTFRGGVASEAQPLVPGEACEVEIPLTVIAHRFKPGSVIRLSLSEGLWPLVWPSPETVTLDVRLSAAALTLPVRPIPAAEAPFPIPVTHDGFSRGEPALDITQEADGWVRMRGAWPNHPFVVPGIGTQLSGSGPDMQLEIRAGEPNSSKWTITQSSRFRRGDWDCEMRCAIEMRSSATHYVIQERLSAEKNGQPFFSRERTDRIERKGA
ncbi:CocE/NonD family hydrolase [Phenylobacterium montanum]|uniref:CocE/NonD family hydrolase n=1 Tax=Phenylobacterium montanum TaxID=2823693 RepID=A0A975G1Q7_9CAUL|nr:CocE/NonD family hydrolase [Caulobacter sp. S6]QUD89503.1 CocE/NonD family hydrolase [Caulobacter sp. S6]